MIEVDVERHAPADATEPIRLVFCDKRRRDGKRCGEPLFRARLTPGSVVEGRCHKCGQKTMIAA